MKKFSDYADKAIVRYGLTGYNNLARELGLNKASVSYLRSGKNLPSEETMIKLAELAGLPKEEALIDLNLWRSKDKPEVQKIWLRLSKMIGCALTFLVFSDFAIKPCFAYNKTPAHGVNSGHVEYILCDKCLFNNILRKIKALFSTLVKILAKRGLNYA